MPTSLVDNKAHSTKRRSVALATFAPAELPYSRDVLKLSPDVYEEVVGAPTSGPEELQHVAIKSIDNKAQWVVFSAELDKSLGARTVALGATSSHEAAAGVLLSGSGLIRQTSPVVLDHVVLTFPPDLYQTAKARFEKHGALDAMQTRNKILRHGDYDSELGFTVKVCEPVDQGLLSSKTKITVVKETPVPADHATNDHIDDVELEISSFLSFEEDSKTVEFQVHSLLEPVDIERLTPRPDRGFDPECMGFVKVEQLAKLGCFSGDMVSVKSDKGGTRKLRLFSFPEPNTASSNALYVSPILLYNMGSISTVTISKHESSASIPTASEVTISRIAAPSTTDRTLQPACLSGLRTHFESFKRVVKEGDVIAIPIDTLMAQTLYGAALASTSPTASGSGAGSGSGNNSAAQEETPDMGILPGGKPNDVAWYKITSIVCKDKDKDEVGECAIDPVGHTRMVQSGLVTEKCPSTELGWKHFLSLPEYPDFDLKGKGDFDHAKKLQQLITASISPHGVALQTTILVHSTKRGTGKSTMIKSVAAYMGVHCFEIDCYQLIGESDVKTIGALRARLDRAASISPCILLLRHVDAIAKKSEQDGGDTGIIAQLIDVFGDYSDKKSFIIAATVGDVDKISEAIRSKFKFEVVVPVPTEAERRKIFGHICSKPLDNTRLSMKGSLPFKFLPRSDVSLDNLALQSAGLTPPDLQSIMEIAKIKALARINTISGVDQDDLVLAYGGTVKMIPEDIEESIAEARTKYSDSIGAPRIPNVGWEDVGGLDGVKKEILDTIEMPLKYPKLFSGGMKKRSGILFYGPPGTGKTLLAKAIATSFSLNFFSVKGPELLNMYIGESEANVRKVFQKARDAKPCVVFFDELDSVAPKRGNQGDSGGVMDRIVSQLLAELDGMSGAGGEGVFVVGATNRPDLLDEALLRPGRFDKMLYLGISDTHDKQRTILEALTRKFTLGDGVDLAQVAEKCPFTYTGADFYALSSDAMLNAMTRTAGVVDEKIKAYNTGKENPVSTRWWFQNVATADDTNVKVTVADFDKAQRDLVPSVSAEELQHYLRVRENFEGGKEKKPQPQPQPHEHENEPHAPHEHENGSMTVGEYMNAANGTANGNGNGHANGSTKRKKKGKGKEKVRDM